MIKCYYFSALYFTRKDVLNLEYQHLYSSEDFIKEILTLKDEKEVREKFIQKKLDFSDDEFEELKSALDLVVRRRGQVTDDVTDQICGPKWSEGNKSSLSIRAIVRAAGSIINNLPYDFYRKFGKVWFYNPENDIVAKETSLM